MCICNLYIKLIFNPVNSVQIDVVVVVVIMRHVLMDFIITAQPFNSSKTAVITAENMHRTAKLNYS